MVRFPWLAFLVLSSGGLAWAQPAPQFQEVPCPNQISASRCGYVQVPLDHAHPTGPQIKLFVAVQRAARNAVPDPLFYLEGGPGAPSSISVGQLGLIFPNRDLVGVDQRGVGRSEPALNCPALNRLNSRQDVSVQEIAPLFSQALTECAESMRGQQVALEFFNTTQAAQDIEFVRRALGYDSINLYGASYGTRLAQEVMRRSPQHLRAVVLDSVIPTTVDRVTRTPLAVQQALKRVFAACAGQPNCAARYPKLEDTYRAALQALNARPLPVTVKGETAELDGAVFQALLMGSLYFPQGLTEVPSLIVAARDRQAGVIAQSFAVKLSEVLSDMLSWGAFYSNECPGEVAYSSPAQLQANLKAAPEFADTLSLVPGISSTGIFRVCQAMHLTQPAPLENEAVQSDVPTLLLAGEFDPVTPAAWLPEASQKLSHSSSVVVNGAAHGSGLTSQCGYQAVISFLNDPSQPVQPACATQGQLRFK